MRVVDLFAGCGGMSQGFQEADCEVSLAVEWWEPARTVYEKNFGPHAIDLDLNDFKTAIKLIKLEKPDVIVGGPPCQEFSPAGQRVEGDRAALTSNFAKIVSGVRPEWFVLENVPAISKSAVWKEARGIFQAAGYGLSEAILDAAYFGVPQHRKRFFAVGRLGEDDGFIDDAINKKISVNSLSINDYLGDELGVQYYYRHPRNWGRRGIFSINEPSPTIRSTNRRIPPGYVSHPKDAGPIDLAKPLTPEQRARIQTFEADFVFKGFDTWKDTMIANAVPVRLAKHVATAIKNHCMNEAMVDDPSFRSWLLSDFEYTSRTISNVVSRLRRGSKIIGHPLAEWEIPTAIATLELSPEFKNLQPSVKSQIRRAFRLRTQFMTN